MIIGCKEASQIKSTEGLLDSFTLNMPSSSLNKSIIVFYTWETAVPRSGNGSKYRRGAAEKRATPFAQKGVTMYPKGCSYMPKRV